MPKYREPSHKAYEEIEKQAQIIADMNLTLQKQTTLINQLSGVKNKEPNLGSAEPYAIPNTKGLPRFLSTDEDKAIASGLVTGTISYFSTVAYLYSAATDASQGLINALLGGVLVASVVGGAIGGTVLGLLKYQKLSDRRMLE